MEQFTDYQAGPFWTFWLLSATVLHRLLSAEYNFSTTGADWFILGYVSILCLIQINLGVMLKSIDG